MRRRLSSEILLNWMKNAIPPLEASKHKGQAGKICVIGGSKEYTGGPYFSAISALLCGADLVHVICPEDAAPIIKSYSPELIVHPILCTNRAECHMWLDKMHAVVLGPGLGRDNTSESLELLHYIRSRDIPVVIDADGLHLIGLDPSVISGYTRAVLTPNINEARMLYKKIVADDSPFNSNEACCAELATSLGHVTIVAKGKTDIITDGIQDTCCNLEGSLRRCGGQGDLLSGVLGVMLFWCYQRPSVNSNSIGSETLTAAYSACHMTRMCAQKAFAMKQRSTTTSDMINLIGQVFNEMFPTSNY